MGSFADEVAAFVTKTEKKIEDTTREAVIETASEIVMNTPVVQDPVPRQGAARGAWDAAGGSGPPDPDGVATVARITGQIEAHPVPGPPVVLANSTPYITELEFGSSRQAPAGMARVAAARFPSKVETKARARAHE
jgi:hypothetical protein